MEASPTPPPKQYVVADLSEPANAKVAGFSARLLQLLKAPKINGDEDAKSCLDDLIGAAQSLFLARHLCFEDRIDKKVEVPPLHARAEDLAQGRVRVDGKWAAGFYFNGALFRLSAVYHRFLKIVDGNRTSREYAGAIQQRVKPMYRAWTSRDWETHQIELVHDEVNTLKHSARGVYDGRTVTYEEACKAFDQLLALLEAWAVA